MTEAKIPWSGVATAVQPRIRLTRSFDSAVSVGQCIVGVVAVGLRLLTAMALGYRPQGSLWDALSVTVISSLGIVGVSMLVAANGSLGDVWFELGAIAFLTVMLFGSGTWLVSILKLKAGR